MLLRNQICERLKLKPAEFLMLTVAIAAAAIDVCLSLYKGAQFDIPAYAGVAGIILFTLPLGFYYRISGRNEGIASALICTGAFILFSTSMSIFNYLLLPLSTPLIDLQLAKLDAYFGYHWPDIMRLASEYPTINKILKYAYMSTISQFAALIIILGLSNRLRDLHVMITSVAITATLTICFWGLFPSMGVTVIYPLSQEGWHSVGPIVDQAYALDMMRIAVEGPGVISPKEIRGLIAFPSYHAVLAFTAMYASRNVPIISIVFLFINLLILPAIFVHGGHHFVDLIGGFMMFAIGTVIAVSAVGRNQKTVQPSTIVAH
ncbi:MAG: phosphatase PAP2 family protein [Pseudomonadota bacterium]